MPRISRTFILTGLLYLMAAMVVGVATVTTPSLPYPVYVHLLGVGWLTQLIFGVAYWMFPGRSKTPALGERLMLWGVYLALNAGVVLRALAEPLLGRPGPWPTLLAVSATAQLVAVLAFATHVWRRVTAR